MLDERIEELLEFFKLHNGAVKGYRFCDFKALKPKKLNRRRKIKNPVKGTRRIKL